MKRFWHVPALAIVCVMVGFSGWLVADVWGQADPRSTPQNPATNTVPPAKPTGTGKISGQIVAADNGMPVKRVTVMLRGYALQDPRAGMVSGEALLSMIPQPASGTPGPGAPLPARGAASGPPPGTVEKQTETDGAGRFEFIGLPAGRFSLIVNSGMRFSPPPQAEPVRLADGGSATVTLRLERTGAITGKVFDEAGDPLPRAQLRASRWVSSGGTRRLVPTSGGGFNMTNDLGEYRLWDVPPGDYYVSASSTPSYNMSQTFEREGPTFGFAPTFYPGAASMEGARTVTVRAGQDTPSVDITLLRAKMGRITGTVFDATGNPLSPRGGSIYLTSRDNSYQAGGGVQRRPDGSFMSSDLPPGDYYVVASQMQSGGPAGSGVSESAAVPVTINGDDVTVSIQLNKGATVSGRVVVEGKMPELMTRVTTITGSQSVTSQARIMISARFAASPLTAFFPGSSMGPPAPMADDGTFELTGLRGFVRLFASGNRAVLKSVRRGGQDILATPLELSGTEHITDIEMVVTTETGTFDGSVTNSRGEPASGVDVIIFSDDPARWFEGSSYVRVTRTVSGSAPNAPSAPLPTAIYGSSTSVPAPPTEPGRIIGGPLVPGRYGAIAFESSTGTTGPAYDPETLEKLQSRATFFTVTAGQTVTVHLKTVKQ